MKTITFKTTPEQKDWLKEGGDVSKKLRRLVAQAMAEQQAAKVEEAREEMDPDERFLDAVVEHYRFHKACEAADVDPEEMLALIEEDEDFARAFNEAQLQHAYDVEAIIVANAREGLELNSAAITGIIAWLNNNHPDWGEMRYKSFMRIFRPIFKLQQKAIKKRAPANLYKELAAEFEAITESRLVNLVD